MTWKYREENTVSVLRGVPGQCTRCSDWGWYMGTTACLGDQIEQGCGDGQESHPEVPSADAESWWMRGYSSSRATVKCLESVRKKRIMQRCSYRCKAQRCRATSEGVGREGHIIWWSQGLQIRTMVQGEAGGEAKKQLMKVCVQQAKKCGLTLGPLRSHWNIWGKGLTWLAFVCHTIIPH